MDREQARFILRVSRAGDSGPSDARLAEALALAERDPELRAWLERERAADAAIMRKLKAKEPPERLRAQLLAGARASRPASRQIGLPWWIAIAAAVALVTAGIVWTTRSRPDRESQVATAPLREWQEACLAIFSAPDFALDRMADDYPSLEAFLLERGTRVAGELPFAPEAVQPVGCKVLAWRGQPVSFACFKATTGELVHLFVVPRGVAGEELLRSGVLPAQVGEFATLTWVRDDRILMVASKMPAERLPSVCSGQFAAIEAGSGITVWPGTRVHTAGELTHEPSSLSAVPLRRDCRPRVT